MKEYPMREIKFRAWDVLNNKMLNWGDIFHLPAWEIFPGTPEQRPFNIMQYTGLQDRNGREIYEGDIIEFLENESGETWTAKIVFENLAFKALDVEDGGYEYDFDDLTEIEVIGNIYENPEILKDRR